MAARTRTLRHVDMGLPLRSDGWAAFLTPVLESGGWETVRFQDGSMWRVRRFRSDRDGLRGVLMLDTSGKHPDVLLEILGLDPPAEGGGELFWPRRYPVGAPDLHLIVRRARAYVRGSFVFGELAWTPGDGGEDRIVNPTLARPGNGPAEREAAMRGLELVLGIVRRGRPGEETPAVRAEYLEAARRIVARGDVLSRDALADETFRTPDRTYKRMKKHGVTIASLKRALRGE